MPPRLAKALLELGEHRTPVGRDDGCFDEDLLEKSEFRLLNTLSKITQYQE
jgi:hypothetical protein